LRALGLPQGNYRKNLGLAEGVEVEVNDIDAPEGSVAMTTDDAILAPTKAIQRICDALDAAIERFLRQKALLCVGVYESDLEALLIFNLGIRHVEGVTALARRDLVLLPAPFHLARAALECCVRAAWLVDDAGPMRREARWIAHLDGEISAIRRSSERLEKFGLDVEAARERAQKLTKFRNDVARAVERHGVQLLKQLPNFEQMLSSIDGSHLYSVYIQASQYTHGGHSATWLYRSEGVGTHKQIGEDIRAEQWILPLRMCWLALSRPGDVITTRIAQSASAASSHECSALVDAAFEDLASDRPDLLH
jgi:hypothetical protein